MPVNQASRETSRHPPQDQSRRSREARKKRLKFLNKTAHASLTHGRLSLVRLRARDRNVIKRSFV